MPFNRERKNHASIREVSRKSFRTFSLKWMGGVEGPETLTFWQKRALFMFIFFWFSLFYVKWDPRNTVTFIMQNTHQYFNGASMSVGLQHVLLGSLTKHLMCILCLNSICMYIKRSPFPGKRQWNIQIRGCAGKSIQIIH